MTLNFHKRITKKKVNRREIQYLYLGLQPSFAQIYREKSVKTKLYFQHYRSMEYLSLFLFKARANIENKYLLLVKSSDHNNNIFIFFIDLD